MKNLKVIVSICAIGLTCTFTSVFAKVSGYRTVYVSSNNNVNVADGYKDTNTAKAGAYLSAIGTPDTISFFALDSNNGNLTSFSVTESSTAASVTYGSAYYNGASGSTGKYVKVTARPYNFSFGSFPINTSADFY